MRSIRGIPAGLLIATAILLTSVPAQAQGSRSQAERAAFFDNIHVPNSIWTDIAHTPIKSQRGGTCWNFATLSFLESEVLRVNEAVREALAGSRSRLNLSEYYLVYWAWVEKAREYVKRRGEGARFTDGGLSHDTIWLIQKYGIIPESDFTEPENSGRMTRDLANVLKGYREQGDWNEKRVLADIREVLDRHLAPPPASVEVDGRQMTPNEFANEYLNLDYDNYWEITSYTDFPFYTRGELDVPDNWWDCDTYYNVPLDTYMRIITQALDKGYSVAIDTDWSDIGADFRTSGVAVMHPDQLSPNLVNQQSRQHDFEEGRTSDDHLVHAVDHRVVDGHNWYLIKNSHGIGSGRQGYVWMRGDWMAMRVLAIMVHKDAIDPAVQKRFNPGN